MEQPSAPISFTALGTILVGVVAGTVLTFISAIGTKFLSEVDDPLTEAMSACVKGKNVTMVFNYTPEDAKILESFAIQCQHISDVDKHVLKDINSLLKEKQKGKK